MIYLKRLLSFAEEKVQHKTQVNIITFDIATEADANSITGCPAEWENLCAEISKYESFLNLIPYTFNLIHNAFTLFHFSQTNEAHDPRNIISC